MKNALVASLGCAMFTAMTGAAYAQQTYEHVTCRAGTITVLAKADKMIVWALDHRGVTPTGVDSPFAGSTQRCIGTVAVIAGKINANGWCRNVDSVTGDWTVVDWLGGDKPGHGTWSFRYGTGKWENVAGGGTYEPAGQTKPVEDGTYQNCVRVKGMMKMPAG